MLSLPSFDIVSPTSIDGAIEALEEPGARLVAGGTDLLPNLKHRMDAAKTLVSLHRLAELRRIEQLEGPAGPVFHIGAMCTLTRLADDDQIADTLPSLARAASLVASPQIRNVGTLGGNINLDTRCRYVNQTAFWREALGGCLKAETCEASGVCHVVPKGRRCVAALSSDTVPVLSSLGATLGLAGRAGVREVAIRDYFRPDGTNHTTRRPDELLTHVIVPIPTGDVRSSYVKWRPRKSIDFPLVSIALTFHLANGSITDGVAVVGVLGATPRVIALDAFVGRRFDDSPLATEIADVVHSRAKPLANVPYDPDYRRRLVRVLTRRAVEAL